MLIPPLAYEIALYIATFVFMLVRTAIVIIIVNAAETAVFFFAEITEITCHYTPRNLILLTLILAV